MGFKVTSSGKLCRCYISPSGKVCYHKYDAETVVGISLPKINLPLDGVGTGIDLNDQKVTGGRWRLAYPREYM